MKVLQKFVYVTIHINIRFIFNWNDSRLKLVQFQFKFYKTASSSLNMLIEYWNAYNHI